MKRLQLLPILITLMLVAPSCQSQTVENKNTTPTSPVETNSQTLLQSVTNIDQQATLTEPLTPEVVELEQQSIPVLEKKEDREDTSAQVENGVTLYRGYYFDIEYPSNFTPNPTSPLSVFNEAEYVQSDEAFFTSPDATVEFFVYSPLWSGNPKTYLDIAENEELVSEKTETSEALPNQLKDSTRLIRWVTVKAKDGSYYRSYVSIKEQIVPGENSGSEIHHVFGIKYSSSSAYDKYKDAYSKFKNSLRQYAD